MGQIRRGFDGLTIEGDNDIARLQSSALRRRVSTHLCDQSPPRSIQSKGFSQITIDILNTDTQPAPLDHTVFLDLRHHIADDGNRDRKRQADGAP